MKIGCRHVRPGINVDEYIIFIDSIKNVTERCSLIALLERIKIPIENIGYNFATIKAMKIKHFDDMVKSYHKYNKNSIRKKKYPNKTFKYEGAFKDLCDYYNERVNKNA